MLHAGWARPGLLAAPLAVLSASLLTASCARSRHAPAVITVAGAKKRHKKVAKKKPVNNSEEDQAALAATPEKAPPRIDTTRFRIKTWKRIIKQYQAPAPAPKVAQAFRKPKVEDEERLAREREREEAYKAARKQKSAGSSFASLYGSKGDQVPPVLLVDGYNVLGRIAGCSSDDEEGGEAVAAAFAEGPRHALQNRLCEYSHIRQVKVVLVFDALGGGGGVMRTTARGAIDVVYCGESDADSWIMLEVVALKEKGTPLVLVATSDREMKDSIAGAHIVSSEALVKEITKAENDSAARMRASQMKQWQERPGIGANVLSKNPGLYEKLEAMRAGRFS